MGVRTKAMLDGLTDGEMIVISMRLHRLTIVVCFYEVLVKRLHRFAIVVYDH